MGPERFQRQNFSLFLVKFKKLGFSAPLTEMSMAWIGVGFWPFWPGRIGTGLGFSAGSDSDCNV